MKIGNCKEGLLGLPAQTNPKYQSTYLSRAPTVRRIPAQGWTAAGLPWVYPIKMTRRPNRGARKGIPLPSFRSTTPAQHLFRTEHAPVHTAVTGSVPYGTWPIAKCRPQLVIGNLKSETSPNLRQTNGGQANGRIVTSTRSLHRVDCVSAYSFAAIRLPQSGRWLHRSLLIVHWLTARPTEAAPASVLVETAKAVAVAGGRRALSAIAP